MPQENIDRYINKIALFCERQLLPFSAFVFFIFQIWNYFFTQFSYDETDFFYRGVKFYTEVSNEGFGRLISQPNHLGYGAIYWYVQILGSAIIHWFQIPLESFQMPMRIMSFICAMAVPLSLYHPALFSKLLRDTRAWALILYFVMPSSWWIGKITGPETFSQAFGVLGIGLIFSSVRGGLIWGAFLIGMALGFKVTALPFFLFPLAVGLAERKWIESLKLSGISIFAYLLSNLFLIFAPQKAEFGDREPVTNYLYQLGEIIFRSRWESDHVFSGGLIFWSFPVLVWLVVIGIAFFRSERKVFGAFVISSLALFAMVLNNFRFLGWYLFPILFLVPIVFLNVKMKLRLEKYLFGLTLCFALCFSAPFVVKAFQVKMEDDRILTTPSFRNEVELCVAKFAPFDKIIDFAGSKSIFPLSSSQTKMTENLVTQNLAGAWLNRSEFHLPDIQKGSLAVIVGRTAEMVDAELPFLLSVRENDNKLRAKCEIGDGALNVYIF